VEWNLKTYTNEKSLAMKIVTQSFEHKDGKKRLFGIGTDEADIVNDVSYIA
jgi:YidC/Oxa1 family membrane protein insertase